MTKLLTPEEVSTRLRMCLKQTRKIIKEEKFPKIKIGRKYLIPEDKFEDWIKQYTYKEFKVKGLS